MRKKEQRLWDRMRNNLSHACWLNRIENLVGAGDPDVNVVVRGNGRIIPVELKQIDTFPKRKATPVLGRDGLNQNQLNWHLEFRRVGGRAFILVGVGPVNIYFVDAKFHDEINAMPAHILEHVSIATSWKDIISYLKELR